jgi:hypothetical protein
VVGAGAKSKEHILHERVRGCDRTRSRVNYWVLAVLPYKCRPTLFLSLALAKKTDGSAPDGEKTADYLGSKINALYRTDDV